MKRTQLGKGSWRKRKKGSGLKNTSATPYISFPARGERGREKEKEREKEMDEFSDNERTKEYTGKLL